MFLTFILVPFKFWQHRSVWLKVFCWGQLFFLCFFPFWSVGSLFLRVVPTLSFSHPNWKHALLTFLSIPFSSRNILIVWLVLHCRIWFPHIWFHLFFGCFWCTLSLVVVSFLFRSVVWPGVSLLLSFWIPPFGGLSFPHSLMVLPLLKYLLVCSASFLFLVPPLLCLLLTLFCSFVFSLFLFSSKRSAMFDWWVVGSFSLCLNSYL